MHRAFKERDTNFWSHPSLHLRHGLFHLYFVQIIGNLPVSGKATSSVKPSSLFVWQLSTNECLREWMSESESEIEVAQSCQTLCDPVDCSPTGSSVHGILQARVLEWVAISYSSMCVYTLYNTHTYVCISLCTLSFLKYRSLLNPSALLVGM